MPRPGHGDNLAYDCDHIPILIPINGAPASVSSLLPGGTNIINIVNWEISGDRAGVARDKINVAALAIAPAPALPVGQTIQIPAGVDYQPPVGRHTLAKIYIESTDGSTIDAVLIVYRASEQIIPD